MLHKSLYILVLVGIFACTATQKTVDNTPKSTKPMVLTMILEMQTSSQGAETMVKLLDRVKAAGHVKMSPDQPANFEFRFVDSHSHTVQSVFKKVNLTKVYEYADDNGVLRKKVMDGEPVVVPVRVNYQPEMEKLVVYQMIKEDFEPVATFLIQPKNIN